MNTLPGTSTLQKIALRAILALLALAVIAAIIMVSGTVYAEEPAADVNRVYLPALQIEPRPGTINVGRDEGTTLGGVFVTWEQYGFIEALNADRRALGCPAYTPAQGLMDGAQALTNAADAAGISAHSYVFRTDPGKSAFLQDYYDAWEAAGWSGGAGREVIAGWSGGMWRVMTAEMHRINGEITYESFLGSPPHKAALHDCHDYINAQEIMDTAEYQQWHIGISTTGNQLSVMMGDWSYADRERCGAKWRTSDTWNPITCAYHPPLAYFEGYPAATFEPRDDTAYYPATLTPRFWDDEDINDDYDPTPYGEQPGE